MRVRKWLGIGRRLSGWRHSSLIPAKSLQDFLPKPPLGSDAETLALALAQPPYLVHALESLGLPAQTVYIETYGCQMNFNDSEIVLGILEASKGYRRTTNIEDADIVLLLTCAIRENAEAKIWSRLDALSALERRRGGKMTVGILGCMAERLKSEVLERKRNVDIVCGPDAYRDLPRLLRSNALDGINGINVMLSADETYADIAPVRLDPAKKSAFVSIMRGCNNMCAFCIVPFTRERSRPIESVVEEVRRLAGMGVREITLLGQNVNSYCDETIVESLPTAPSPADGMTSRGFTTVYKPRVQGRRFVDLLERVSSVDPEMRIRFTSPHPKDFPDGLLHLMRDRANICKQIHLPAQSGSTALLDRMRRGYTRDAYLELVSHIREIMPHAHLSSDFISGFCGETEEDHQDTVTLLERVGYDMAYMYAYSLREKTMAHRKYVDDVPEQTKQRRLAQVIQTFYSLLTRKVAQTVGESELVLVEGASKKSDADLAGRGDGGRVIVFPREAIDGVFPAPGDYVRVEIVRTVGATPVGRPIEFSSIAKFNAETPQTPQTL